jgi:hypothetical protein
MIGRVMHLCKGLPVARCYGGRKGTALDLFQVCVDKNYPTTNSKTCLTWDKIRFFQTMKGMPAGYITTSPGWSTALNGPGMEGHKT